MSDTRPYLSLLDCEPIPSRDPFAAGAGVPMSVETANSRYVFTEHALMVDSPATVTLTCEKGTFAGQSWVVERADVVLTRYCLLVKGDLGLRTTAPVRVNETDVAYWSPEAKLAREREDALKRSRAYAAALRAERLADRPKDPTYGMCTACGSIETALNRVSGHRDLSHMGESDAYPTGYGCENCS